MWEQLMQLLQTMPMPGAGMGGVPGQPATPGGASPFNFPNSATPFTMPAAPAPLPPGFVSPPRRVLPPYFSPGPAAAPGRKTFNVAGRPSEQASQQAMDTRRYGR